MKIQDKNLNVIGINFNLVDEDVTSYNYYASKIVNGEYRNKINLKLESDNKNIELNDIEVNFCNFDISYDENNEYIRESLFEEYDFDKISKQPMLEKQKNYNNKKWKRKVSINRGIFGLNILRENVKSNINVYDFDDQFYESNFGLILNNEKFETILNYDTNENISLFIKQNFDILGEIGFGFKQAENKDTDYYFWNKHEDTFTTGIYANSNIQKIYFIGNLFPSKHKFASNYLIDNSGVNLDLLSLGYKYSGNEELIEDLEMNCNFDINNDFDIYESNFKSKVSLNNIRILNDYSYKNNQKAKLNIGIEKIDKNSIINC